MRYRLDEKRATVRAADDRKILRRRLTQSGCGAQHALQYGVVIGMPGNEPPMPEHQPVTAIEQRGRSGVGVDHLQPAIEQQTSAFRPVQYLTIGMQIRRRPIALNSGGGPECLCRHVFEADAGTARRRHCLVRRERAPSRALDERLPRSRDHRVLPLVVSIWGLEYPLSVYPATLPIVGIAVGTSITGRPPHRTVRAAFPHTAPTLGG